MSELETAECDDCGYERPVDADGEPVGPCLCDFDGTEPTEQELAEQRAGMTPEEFEEWRERFIRTADGVPEALEGDDE